jgi:hypothetical protein
MSAVWSLSGGKRTLRLRSPTSEFDPERTFGLNDPSCLSRFLKKPHSEGREAKKPQAFARCGSPGSKIDCL